MRVKCVNIYNKFTKKFVDESDWITIGREYVVLEINARSGKDTLYRLVGDWAVSKKYPSICELKKLSST
jgi:hypothetical protein